MSLCMECHATGVCASCNGDLDTECDVCKDTKKCYKCHGSGLTVTANKLDPLTRMIKQVERLLKANNLNKYSIGWEESNAFVEFTDSDRNVIKIRLGNKDTVDKVDTLSLLLKFMKKCYTTKGERS